MVEVANRGGDADTTAATAGIAGMLAGALYGPEAPPERWRRRLEAPTRAVCEAQARTLIRLAPLARGVARPSIPATRELAFPGMAPSGGEGA